MRIIAGPDCLRFESLAPEDFDEANDDDNLPQEEQNVDQMMQT